MANARQLIRDWLERSHRLQKDLAAEIGVSDAYLSQALTGIRRPKLETLLTIERVTGVPVSSWAEMPDGDSGTDTIETTESSDLPRVKDCERN